MVTRFVPGGYQPEHGRETHGREGAARRRRARGLIDDYEFHYPGELSRGQPRRGPRGARRPRHLLHRQRPARRPALRQGRPHLARRRRARDGAARSRARPRTSPASWARTSSSGPGSRATTTRSRRPTARAGAADRGHRRGRRDLRRARRQALPRAQELRAGDEDPHAQHRDDAARHPQAAGPGDRQRPGQHGLAAPDHERREPGRVRRAAVRRGAARPPARQLRLGHVRRRQHGRRDRVHGDARARRRAAARELRRQRRAARASTSTRTPRTRWRRSSARCSSGASSTSIAAKIDDAALREAQSRKDAVRAYELVYAALGRRRHERRDRARRRHHRAQGARRLRGRRGRRPRRASSTASRPRSRAGPSRTRRTGGAAAQEALEQLGADEVAGIGLSGQMHGLVALDADEQVLRPAILWNDQRTRRRVRGDRGADRARAADRGDRQPRADRLHRAEAAVAGEARARGPRADRAHPAAEGLRAAEADAASARSTSPTRRARCCSTSRTGSGATRCARRWTSPAEWLPRALESAEVSGETSDGIPVAAGAGDQAAGALGVGVTHAGEPLSVVLGHLRRRVRGAAVVRGRPRGARARVLPRGAGHVARDGRDAQRRGLAALAARRDRRGGLRRRSTRRRRSGSRASRASRSCPTWPASARRTPTPTRAARSSGCRCATTAARSAARCWRAWPTACATRST